MRLLDESLHGVQNIDSQRNLAKAAYAVRFGFAVAIDVPSRKVRQT
jgi:hypothetical protein